MQRGLIGFVITLVMAIAAYPLLQISIDEDATTVPTVAPSTEAEPEPFADEDQLERRALGYPRIIFESTEATIEPFMKWLDWPQYLVLGYRDGFRFDLFWHALWEQDVFGAAEIEMIVLVKAPFEDD